MLGSLIVLFAILWSFVCSNYNVYAHTFLNNNDKFCVFVQMKIQIMLCSSVVTYTTKDVSQRNKRYVATAGRK